jgi:RNA recognition motif-containing protein
VDQLRHHCHYQARCVVAWGVQLYVGNLPVEATAEDLIEAFQVCGSVVDCKVIVQKEGAAATPQPLP